MLHRPAHPLGEELGIEPGHTLRRLEEEILAQSPTLEWFPPPAEPHVGDAAPASAETLATTVWSGDRAGAGPDGHSGPATLVGRSGEVGALEGALDGAERGSGRVVMVSGEPGIGKTRLVEEVAASAGRRGATVAWGRCHPAEGAPAYWPWIEILSSLVDGEDPVRLGRALGSGAGDIAQLVPEVKELVSDIVPPPPLDPAAARRRPGSASTRPSARSWAASVPTGPW